MLEETQCQRDSVLCIWEAVLTPPREHSRATQSLQVNPSQSLSPQRQEEVKQLRKSWLAPRKSHTWSSSLPYSLGSFRLIDAQLVLDRSFPLIFCLHSTRDSLFTSLSSQALKGHRLHCTRYTITKLALCDLKMIAWCSHQNIPPQALVGY